MELYRELSRLSWDPACSDPCFDMHDCNRRLQIKSTGVRYRFPKAISDRPIDTRQRSTIQLQFSNSLYMVGLLCASSKEELHQHISLTADGKDLISVAQDGPFGCILDSLRAVCLEERRGEMSQKKNLEGVICDICSLQIEPEDDQILWILDGTVKWVSRIPSDGPVFLVYASCHMFSTVQILSNKFTH